MHDGQTAPLPSVTTERFASRAAIVRVTGDADLALAPALGGAIAAEIAAGRRRIAIDLSAATFIDCSTVGMLLDALWPLRDDGDVVAGTTAATDVNGGMPDSAGEVTEEAARPDDAPPRRYKPAGTIVDARTRDPVVDPGLPDRVELLADLGGRPAVHVDDQRVRRRTLGLDEEGVDREVDGAAAAQRAGRPPGRRRRSGRRQQHRVVVARAPAERGRVGRRLEAVPQRAVGPDPRRGEGPTPRTDRVGGAGP